MSLKSKPRGARLVTAYSATELAIEIHEAGRPPKGTKVYWQPEPIARVKLSKREALRLARTLLNFAVR